MTAPQDPLLFRPAQVQQLDRAAIAGGIEGFDLMRRAGRAAFRHLRRSWPQAQQLLVFCGGGNNGGDGYVVAGMARQQGLAVVCVAVSAPEKLKGEARQAWLWAREQGVTVSALDTGSVPVWLKQADLVVDALLGTGLKGEVRSPYRELIEQINESETPVIAIDGPSGLCAETGQPLGLAVEAQQSVTFIGRKVGLYTGQARHYTGPVAFDDLGVPGEIYQEVGSPRGRLLHWSIQSRCLPRLSPCAHKGHMGRILVVGGDLGMGGAGLLAAEAALRSGSGLVYLATRGEHVNAVLARRPEIQVRAVTHGNDLAPLLALADVIVIGPGLGQDPWGQQMLQQVLAWQGPVVVDADALNLIADPASPLGRDGLPGHWLATPHPGEAARLLGCTVADIEQDRMAALERLLALSPATWVLKGAGTLVGAPAELPGIVAEGNAGMASGGMGDVLSGIVASLLGQGMSAPAAAMAGACLHAAAADQAARVLGPRSLLAADLCEFLPSVLAAGSAAEALADE